MKSLINFLLVLAMTLGGTSVRAAGALDDALIVNRVPVLTGVKTNEILTMCEPGDRG